MEMCVLVFQEVRKCPSHATIVTFKYKVILDLKKISPRLVTPLLTITAVRTPEVIQVCLLTGEEGKARGY
tara:strand:+ start:217 stop:426 length:210 start_codon:yes stop_codon:yes gene_type:complete